MTRLRHFKILIVIGSLLMVAVVAPACGNSDTDNEVTPT